MPYHFPPDPPPPPPPPLPPLQLELVVARVVRDRVLQLLQETRRDGRRDRDHHAAGDWGRRIEGRLARLLDLLGRRLERLDLLHDQLRLALVLVVDPRAQDDHPADLELRPGRLARRVKKDR